MALQPSATHSKPATEAVAAVAATNLPERYQLKREIQLGGQGACKVVYDQFAEREVVMKIGQPQGIWSGERILKEAHCVAKFNHANVTRLLELDTFGNDQVFMTMPYVEGSTLEQILRKVLNAGIPGVIGYSMTAAAELFDKICAGIEHAHAAGFLHLDLKPQNVLVGNKGEVVVIDWGLSQAVTAAEYPPRFASNEPLAAPTLNSTLTGVLSGEPAVRAVGTPAYMSPEQWFGDPGTFTERTDVYGLGAVLFFLLTGIAPNQVQRPMDLEPYFRHSPTPSPSEFTKRRVPPELEAICVKCLARDPMQRFANAAHLRNELKCWLARPEIWAVYRA